MIPREPQGHLPVAFQVHRSSESQDRGLERKAKMETEKVKDIKERKDGGSPGENSEKSRN